MRGALERATVRGVWVEGAEKEMIITIQRGVAADDWCVWLEAGNSTEMHESFIIGTGATLEAAVTTARTALHDALWDLAHDYIARSQHEGLPPPVGARNNGLAKHGERI